MVGTAIAATDERAPIYSRIILKLSGEALLGHESSFGIHHGTVRRIAAYHPSEKIRQLRREGER